MRAVFRSAMRWLAPDAAELRRFVRGHLPATLTGTGYDIGSGNAPHADILRAQAPGLRMVAVDIEPSPAVAVVADMCRLPVADASAALVTFFESLQYADFPAVALAEARRILHPGGMLLLAYPFLYPEGPDRSLHRWTAEGARRMVEAAGFTVTAEATRGGTGMFVCLLGAGLMLRAIPGWRALPRSRWRKVAAALVWLPWQVLGRFALLLDRRIAKPPYYVGGIVLARRSGG